MLASRTSRWSLGTVLLCVVLLAASWFLLISPRRADADDLTSQATAANAEVGTLQQQLAQLKEEYAGLAAQKENLKAIQAQLPPDADIPSLVRNLQDYAGTAGVTLDSITPGTPAVLGADGTTDSNAVAGVGSVISVPLSISVTGQYFEDSLYLKYLQTQMTRSILVSGLSTTAASGSTTVTTAPTVTTTATPTPTPTPAATTTATQDLTMAVSASVFVLLDGTSTLDDVKAEAKKAAVGTQTTATTSNTSTTR